MIKKLKSNKVFLAFFLSFLLGCLIIIPNIIAGGGVYHFAADFDFQEIPFHLNINYSLKQGMFLWTWFNELGSNFIATYSFYNILSPFNFITYLLPANWFPYLIGPIFIFKYAFAGLTSFLFFKRYVKNKNYAVLGSLLYTFSGFQLTNILFYHFHDVVVFFPLLLYTLDNLVYDKKKWWFGLTVFLCIITNWFFFIGEVIFTVLYYFIKVLLKDYSFDKKIFFQIILESVLGVLMSMFILLPTFLFTISNPRITANWTLISAIKYNFINYFEIARAIFFPPETMSNRAFLQAANYSSVEFYLPVVGAVLASSYLIKNRKDPFSILMILSLIFMFIPILNSSFLLFTTTYYARWFFMPILIMSLLSIKCLDEKISIIPGIVISLGASLLLIIGLFLFNLVHNVTIYHQKYLIVCIVIMVLNIVLTFISSNMKEKVKTYLLISFIFVYVTFMGNYMLYQYKSQSITGDKNYKNYITYSEELEKTIDARSNSTATCQPNLGYTKRIPNIRTFNTNIEGASFNFLRNVGVFRETSTIIEAEEKELNNLLGVKYMISCGENIEEYGYKYLKEIDGYKIYQNEESLEFGFSPKSYITYETFNTLSSEDKVKTLQENILLTEEQIKKYKDLFPNEANYESNKFEYTKNGFHSIINSSEDTLAIYAIPYSEGWTATNNKKEIEIEEVNNGFIAIKINKGKNDIHFTYYPPGLKTGLIISTISIITFGTLYLKDKLTNKKDSKKKKKSKKKKA